MCKIQGLGFLVKIFLNQSPTAVAFAPTHAEAALYFEEIQVPACLYQGFDDGVGAGAGFGADLKSLSMSPLPL